MRANCISPGPIDTPLFGKLGVPDEKIEGMKKMFEELAPLKRMGTAKVASFLASSDSSFVIGEEIQVGGGEGNFRV